MAGILNRLSHAWNVFKNNEKEFQGSGSYADDTGPGFGGSRPDRIRPRYSNERTILTAVLMRISIDAAAVKIRHIRENEDGQYIEDIKSGLNNCLNVEANIDQAASHFRKDLVWTMLNEGDIAVVPVDTSLDPSIGSYDIQTMRVGRVVEWKRKHVRVNIWNEELGCRQDITVEKKYAAVVENPLYEVMNMPNSTVQRLARKLSLLDNIDEISSSGKLDLIIQLPYSVRTDAMKIRAEQRAKDIEFQLTQNSHGIAYTDGTEKITQLNRAVENKLKEQVDDLLAMMYGQLGITPEVMNGTADEAAMINYYNRTIEPILRAISEAMIRSFLTKTARTQGQTLDYFRDPFKLVPMSQFADIADKLARNEVVTANELRSYLGIRPSKDPKADMLINSNMPQPQLEAVPGEEAVEEEGSGHTDQMIADLDKFISEMEEGELADAA